MYMPQPTNTTKRMFDIEHTKTAYWADFVIYALAIIVLVLFLILSDERIGLPYMTTFVVLGLLLWSFLEYTIHRFILHGLEPFRTLHALHHLRPRALIVAPTILTGTLIGLLIFVPAFFATSTLPATAITVGLLLGYFWYALMHHAIHHWPANRRMMQARKRAHALHHIQSMPANYGVTTSLWDRIFGSYEKSGR
jgi:sterol desaturase/sphingolipid hydroxylase (fatty acid hydroxylase superfamily)